MSVREHRSIGEVLSLLQDQYPDVSISKIRFLENQGLIAPERTPSGYRKFYDADVDLLRWILHQQQENYYPLKVIRDLIGSGAAGDAPCIRGYVKDPDEVTPVAVSTTSSITDLIEPPVVDEHPTPRLVPNVAEVDPTGPPPPPPADLGGVANEVLTLDEVARAAGLTIEQVRDVERFGLIAPLAGAGGDPLYDRSALDVARVAAAFRSAGIEPRHLRTYKTSADREAGLLMQAAVTVQRHAGGGEAARELTGDLAALGRRLHEVLLLQALPPEIRPE